MFKYDKMEEKRVKDNGAIGLEVPIGSGFGVHRLG